jgi:hypothetical protein
MIEELNIFLLVVILGLVVYAIVLVYKNKGKESYYGTVSDSNHPKPYRRHCYPGNQTSCSGYDYVRNDHFPYYRGCWDVRS